MIDSISGGIWTSAHLNATSEERRETRLGSTSRPVKAEAESPEWVYEQPNDVLLRSKQVSTSLQNNCTSATLNHSKTDCNWISVGAESSSPADSHPPPLLSLSTTSSLCPPFNASAPGGGSGGISKKIILLFYSRDRQEEAERKKKRRKMSWRRGSAVSLERIIFTFRLASAMS